jgi:tetratricopeptide (TPR) repeat protein
MEKLLAELDHNGLLRLVASETLPLHYRLHDLTYSYAHNLFKSSGRHHEAMTAAVQQFLGENVADENRGQVTNYDALEFELLNILGAARAAYHESDDEALIDIMRQLVVKANYLTARGPSSAALELLEAAINAATIREDYEAAHYFTGKLGNVYSQITGQYELAVEVYSKSLDFARKMSDLGRQAILLSLLAIARFKAGLNKVDWYYEEASRAAEESGDAAVMAMIFNHRSFHTGGKNPPDYEAGRQFSNAAIHIARENELSDILFSSLNNRAVFEKQLGLLENALQTDLEAYQLSQEINNQLWIAVVSKNLGDDYHALGDRVQAHQHFRNALILAQQLRDNELISLIKTIAAEHNYEILDQDVNEKNN